jgi:glycosyltransferase involved in cell wall biosynthesis
LHRSPNAVTIVIPTLNEERGLDATIRSLPLKALLDIGYISEVIIVDSESSDSTREVAFNLGAKVIVEKRMGYGRALKTGIESASGEIIITLDGDATYPTDLIPKYVRFLHDQNLDFITVNRFSAMNDGAMSLSHNIGNKVLSLFMRFLYSVNIEDSQSGMWIMRKGFVEQINMTSNSMSFSEEIKIIAFKYFKSAEVEGKYFKRVGKPKLQTISHGWYNLRFLFWYKHHLPSAIRNHTAEVQELIVKNCD